MASATIRETGARTQRLGNGEEGQKGCGKGRIERALPLPGPSSPRRSRHPPPCPPEAKRESDESNASREFTPEVGPRIRKHLNYQVPGTGYKLAWPRSFLFGHLNLSPFFFSR